MRKMTHTSKTKGFLSPYAKALLLIAMAFNVSGATLSGTFAAWQVTDSIAGNSVSTGVWSSFSTSTVVINGNTSAGENQPGWIFGRDPGYQTPFAFNDDEFAIGEGSLYVPPIGTTPSDKFIGELFLLEPIANFKKISYDFMIHSSGNANDAQHFYMNVYANFGTSSSTKFYDCRYNIIPSATTPGVWQTLTFDTSVSQASVTQHGSSPFTCPSVPADMETISPGSTIRVVVMNLGQSTDSDVGKSGYFDNSVVERVDSSTIYDFEPLPVTSSSETIVVTPGNMDGWEFNSDRTTWTMGAGSGMVNGPSTAPLGNGSARLTALVNTPNAGDRSKLRKYLPAGTQISDIETLKYSTYRASPNGGALAIALQFDVNFDGTPNDPLKADARLVYEPYHTQQAQIVDDAWQEWDALNDSAGTGTGAWWLTGLSDATNCSQAFPCTWIEINSIYPDMQISGKSLENTIDTEGAMLFKAGGNWLDFDGSVDKFVFGLKNGANTHTITYDFEPDSVDTPYAPVAGDVIINEVMWMGSDLSDADEWIELHNTTDQDIDLSGWVIENLGTGANPDITIPSGTILAGGYFLVSNYPANHGSSAINNFIAVDYATTDVQLLNSGEQLTLRDAGNNIIDQTSTGAWAAGNNTTGSKQSMERNNIPGDGTLITSWHTCIDSGCTSTAFWDTSANNYGTPQALNLSENDPTAPDYINQDWSDTIGWVTDENDVVDDSELISESLSVGGADMADTKTESIATPEVIDETEIIDELPEESPSDQELTDDQRVAGDNAGDEPVLDENGNPIAGEVKKEEEIPTDNSSTNTTTDEAEMDDEPEPDLEPAKEPEPEPAEDNQNA